MNNLPQTLTREDARILQAIATSLQDNYCADGTDQGKVRTVELDLAKEIDAIVTIEYEREFNPHWNTYETASIHSCLIQYEDAERHLNASEMSELEMYLLD